MTYDEVLTMHVEQSFVAVHPDLGQPLRVDSVCVFVTCNRIAEITMCGETAATSCGTALLQPRL